MAMLKLICPGFILSLFFCQGYAQTASVKGNIADQVSRDGLAGATISLEHTLFHQAADVKGNFDLEHIPAGEYDLLVTTVGYVSLRRHIVLKPGETQKLFLELSPEGYSLNEVTVFGKEDREKEKSSRDQERNAANIINVVFAAWRSGGSSPIPRSAASAAT